MTLKFICGEIGNTLEILITPKCLLVMPSIWIPLKFWAGLETGRENVHYFRSNIFFEVSAS